MTTTKQVPRDCLQLLKRKTSLKLLYMKNRLNRLIRACVEAFFEMCSFSSSLSSGVHRRKRAPDEKVDVMLRGMNQPTHKRTSSSCLSHFLEAVPTTSLYSTVLYCTVPPEGYLQARKEEDIILATPPHPLSNSSYVTTNQPPFAF